MKKPTILFNDIKLTRYTPFVSFICLVGTVPKKAAYDLYCKLGVNK